MCDNLYTKMIDCPAHPTGRVHWWDPRKHQAILFCAGSKWAGVWECQATGDSDACEHDQGWHIESVTVPTMRNGEYDDYEREVYVCDLCEETIDLDVADPLVDRQEAIDDMAIMEALGK